MFRGFATLNYYADDLAAALEWYEDLFGVKAYYAYPKPPDTPAYVEFRIGDDGDEIGFIDRRFAPDGGATQAGGPSGAVMHWHVDDLPGTLARLLEKGATQYSPITEHGDGSGFTTAAVVDPFGNILGIMHNPHYLEVLEARNQGQHQQ